MNVTYRTEPMPGGRNEDFVVAGPSWVVVLDGATARADVDSGCRHDVSWLVGQLGSALARQLVTRAEESLPTLLAAAIRGTMAAHGDVCDLGNPDSPSSTVAVLRERAGLVEYLVLCDSSVVLRGVDGTLAVVHDDRVDRLPGGRPYSVELVRSSRNRVGGFWVASTCPEAAGEALTGAVPAGAVDGVLMVTDGVSRLVEWYGRTWEEVVATAAKDGPGRLVEQVREAETEHGPRGGAKRHDDATAVWVTW
ncbi:protein phosphatase 2C domain-containing protein [Thermopolyspora sp. NPDC052614]|uniref:protein phosphatase 2C domain-containing protein n=1 Tax=Thermopolyspora sp. NPDC052614 TaxID=3155682 RepID=UPI00342D5A08